MSAFKDFFSNKKNEEKEIPDHQKVVDPYKHKMGKGQYQVHLLIEATSGLTQQERDVSCDALIIVKAFGHTQYSKTKNNVGIQETFWGQHMFFSKTFSKNNQVQRQSVVIQIWDRNKFSFDALIGNYQIDVQRIYSQKDHAFHHAWFALSNVQRKFNQICGYIKLSVSVIGQHDSAIQLQCQPLTSITAQKKVLMPPHIQRKGYQLTVQVHRGINIKPADGQTVDSYIGVQFGRIYERTQVVRSTRDPQWNEKLYIPLSLPTVVDNIAIRLIDFNIIQKPQVIGSHYININRLIQILIDKEDLTNSTGQDTINEYKGYSQLKWLNFYGPQLKSSYTDKKKVYQSYPDLAPYFVGSVLVKFDIEENSDPILFRQPIKKKAVLAKLLHYKISAVITAGLNLQNNGKNYSIGIKCGQSQMTTNQTICNNGFCVWSVQKHLTVSFHQNQDVPDIFVYLIDHNDKKICFARFQAKLGQITQDKWIQLQPDLSVVKLKHEQAGYLKLALRMDGTDKKVKQVVTKPVKNQIAKIANSTTKKNGKIIIQLISAQNLLPLDEEGTSDPFFVFNFMTSQATSSVKNQTINPIYFEKIIMDAQILDEQSCPPLVISCYDQDRFSRQFMGSTFIDIGDGILNQSVAFYDGLKDTKPAVPRWHNLKQNGVVVGRFLASFTFKKKNSLQIPPQIDIPKKKFKINLMIYGLRGMKSNGFFSVKKPYIEFNYEDLNVYTKIQGQNIHGKQFGYYNKNVITEPNQAGSSVNIQMVNQTILQLPQNPDYWPSLTAVVKDNLIQGLVQPILGYFALNLREAYQQTLCLRQQLRQAVKNNNTFFKKLKNKLHAKSHTAHKLKDIHPKLIISLRTFILKTINYNWTLVSKSTKLNSLKKYPNQKLNPTSIVLFPQYQQSEQGMFLQVNRDYMKTNQEYMSIGYDPKQIRQNATFDKRRKHYRFMMNQSYQSYYERVYGTKMGLSIQTQVRRGRAYYGQDTATLLLKKTTDQDSFVGTYKGNCYINQYKQDQTAQDRQFNKYSNDIMKKFLNKTKLKCFLYVIQAASLPSKDQFSLSDPYLIIRCGDTVIDLQQFAFTDTSNPQFNRRIQFQANFPRDSVLQIEVWDQDPMSADDHIGTATIDLQNRVLANSLNSIANNPIETHQLKTLKSKRSQGLIRFWLDLIPFDQISMYRPFQITPKQEAEFQIRVIIWSVFGMPINDTQGMTDLYVSCTFQDETQQTDTHFRSTTGDGSFNWRCVFKTKLPVQNPTLAFRVFDKDILSSDDYLASTSISIGQYLDEAYQSDCGQKLFLGPRDLSQYNYYPTSTCKRVNGKKMYDIFELDLYCRKQNQYELKKKGTLQVSIQILTQSQAKKKPAGLGRQDPNQHPNLPQPKDRFAFSWNPITLLTRLLGRGFRYQITCFLIIIIIVLLVWNFGQAFGGSIIANTLSAGTNNILGLRSNS